MDWGLRAVAGSVGASCVSFLAALAGGGDMSEELVIVSLAFSEGLEVFSAEAGLL